MDRIKKAFTDVTNALSRDNRTTQENTNESFLNQEDNGGNTILQRGQEVLYTVKRNANELKDYAVDNVSKHAQQAKETTSNLYEHAKETTSNLYQTAKFTASVSADLIKESTAGYEEKAKNTLINFGDQIKNTASSVYDGAKEKMPEVSESNKARIQSVKSAANETVKEVQELSALFNQYIGEKIVDFKDIVLYGGQTIDDDLFVDNAFMQQDINGLGEQKMQEKTSDVGKMPLEKVGANLVEKASDVGETPLDKSEAKLLEKVNEVKGVSKSEVDLVVDRLKELCDDDTDELHIEDSTPVTQSTNRSVNPLNFSHA